MNTRCHFKIYKQYLLYLTQRKSALRKDFRILLFFIVMWFITHTHTHTLTTAPWKLIKTTQLPITTRCAFVNPCQIVLQKRRSLLAPSSHIRIFGWEKCICTDARFALIAKHGVTNIRSRAIWWARLVGFTGVFFLNKKPFACNVMCCVVLSKRSANNWRRL